MTHKKSKYFLLILLLLLAGILLALLSILPTRNHTVTRNPLLTRPALTTNRLVMSVIDVGQGDSILVEFPDQQTMLVDAGDTEHGDTVVNFLRQRHISRINLLVATHPHEDHIGGMEAVLANFPVDKVWDSGYNQGSVVQERFLTQIRNESIRYGTPRQGFSTEMGGTRIDVLAPKVLLSGTESDANNNSLVLHITYHAISFLLTGDMGKEERDTISSWPTAEVLKVAHHGSYTGTDLPFLRMVRPRLAIISCGLHNSYGHPHRETLIALQEAKTELKTTALVGTVVVSTDGNTLTCGVDQSSQPEQIELNVPLVEQKINPLNTTSNMPVSMRYIGNLHSKTFHRPSCTALPAAHNRVVLPSREVAISQGYHPCGRCRP